MVILTKKNIKPDTPEGYEAVLIGVLPCIILFIWPKQYAWGVYPLPPKINDVSDFGDRADSFIKGIPEQDPAPY